MKVYEYLAAGVPTVATALPSLAGVDGVTVVADAREASAALDAAQAEGSERRRERSALAVGHGWDERLAEIGEAIRAAA
jgi:hypothetical protein